MQAIILAGGFGTRLQQVVGNVPKPMAPVAGRPFLAWLLDWLDSQGIRRVILSVHHRAETLFDYFGNRHGNISLLHLKEAVPLGTGGAIRFALQYAAPHQPVFVLNGDTFAGVRYQEMAAEANAPLTMALYHMDNVSRYGTVEIEAEHVCAFHEKGQSGSGLINAGVYLLQPGFSALDDFPAAFSFEQDFLYPHVRRILPAVHVMDGYFIDIGVPEDYKRAGRELPLWMAGCGFSAINPTDELPVFQEALF